MLMIWMMRHNKGDDNQCWASYFVKVTSYILLATELFSYSYILPIQLHIILLCVHSLKLSHVKLPPYHVP